MRSDYDDNLPLIDSALSEIEDILEVHTVDASWENVTNLERSRQERKQDAMELLGFTEDDGDRVFVRPIVEGDQQAWSVIQSLFNQIGESAGIFESD